MSIGLQDQIERGDIQETFCKAHPWSEIKNSHKWGKAMKHRRERYRAKQDPECLPQYRKFKGWEF